MRRLTEEELRELAKRRPETAAYLRQCRAEDARRVTGTEPDTQPPETPNASTGQQ